MRKSKSKKSKKRVRKGILVWNGYRDGGEITKDGKKIPYEEGEVIKYIPKERVKAWSTLIQSDCVKKVTDLLSDVPWGAIIEMQIEDKKVVDVKVLSEGYSELMEDDDINLFEE